MLNQGKHSGTVLEILYFGGDYFIGRKIEEGTIIARVIDLYGEEVEVIRAPSDGYIWAWPLRTDSGLPCPAVYTGSEVAYWFVEKELREPYKSLY